MSSLNLCMSPNPSCIIIALVCVCFFFPAGLSPLIFSTEAHLYCFSLGGNISSKHMLFVTATNAFTSMDIEKGRGSSSDAQLPVVASVYPCIEHWSSTSFQSPTCHEVLSISSLVPSTVITLLPHYPPASSENLYPDLQAFSQVLSEAQLSKHSPSGSSDAEKLTSTLPLNPQHIQQRKPSDGGPLENGAVGIMLPKDPDEQPGMKIMMGVLHPQT